MATAAEDKETIAGARPQTHTHASMQKYANYANKSMQIK